MDKTNTNLSQDHSKNHMNNDNLCIPNNQDHILWEVGIFLNKNYQQFELLWYKKYIPKNLVHNKIHIKDDKKNIFDQRRQNFMIRIYIWMDITQYK